MVLTWGGRQIVALLKGVWPISKWGPPWVVCFNGIALSMEESILQDWVSNRVPLALWSDALPTSCLAWQLQLRSANKLLLTVTVVHCHSPGGGSIVVRVL